MKLVPKMCQIHLQIGKNYFLNCLPMSLRLKRACINEEVSINNRLKLRCILVQNHSFPSNICSGPPSGSFS